MREVVLAYPHRRPSFEAGRMTAREVWRVAGEARDAILRRPALPCTDVAEVIAGSRRLVVNGRELETHWVCDKAVHDDKGKAVFGSTQAASDSDTALLALNAPLIGTSDELWRSTAAHELAHAVFDAPAWMAVDAVARAASFRPLWARRPSAAAPRPTASIPMDWTEWRATEFMGAFLAPRRLLSAHLLRIAVELEVPLTLPAEQGVPALDTRCGYDGIDAVASELAGLFGLTQAFVYVRLRKYRLLHPL